MFDIFLIGDNELFELLVRGQLSGPLAAESIVDAIEHLPGDADVLLDLREVTAADTVAARALRATILDRRAAGGNVVVVTADPDVRAALMQGDVHHVAALAADRREAFRVLPGRLVA